MTAEETRECIHIMENYIYGDRIEHRYRPSDQWRDCESPCWNWTAYEYRIKPIADNLIRNSKVQLWCAYCHTCGDHLQDACPEIKKVKGEK